MSYYFITYVILSLRLFVISLFLCYCPGFSILNVTINGSEKKGLVPGILKANFILLPFT